MYLGIKSINPDADVKYLIHNTKAHGLTPEIMEQVMEINPDLLIIPDAGSNDYEQHAILKSKDITTLVIDHHDAEYLSNTIYDIRSKYYKDVVNLDDKSKYSWIRREHYFYPFYLFKYATGVSAAIMIATKIINNEDDMKNKYISFLKMGDTDYPVELLKKIGIDMTKEEVYENAVNFFSNLIDEFDKESDK